MTSHRPRAVLERLTQSRYASLRMARQPVQYSYPWALGLLWLVLSVYPSYLPMQNVAKISRDAGGAR